MVLREIDKYFKKIDGLARPVVNVPAIIQEGYPINCIVTELKVRGKTRSLKEFLFDEWDGSHFVGVWFRNLVDDLDYEKDTFLDDVKSSMGELRFRKGKRMVVEDKDGNPFVTIMPINSPRISKGSRRYLKYIVWDEFNDSDDRIMGDVVGNFLQLLSRTDKNIDEEAYSERVAFILGNNITLNHELFVQMGISKIDGEVTKINDENGNKLMLLLVPEISEEEAELVNRVNKNDWQFQLAKITGHAGHMYFNKSKYDRMNYVHQYFDFSEANIMNCLMGKKNIFEPMIRMGRPSLTFRVDDSYFNVYNIPKFMKNELGSKWHVVNMTLLWNEMNRNSTIEKALSDKTFADFILGDCYVSSKKRQLDGSERYFSTYELTEIRRLLTHNSYSFENASSRVGFFNLINDLTRSHW